MEELQSTDILDREILEDARKKASRILKTADDTIRLQNGEWEKKTDELLQELDKKFNVQRDLETAKITARSLIDRHRILIDKIETLLHNAVDVWFESLSRSNVINLLKDELSERLVNAGDFSALKNKKAYYSGLNRSEAEKLLKSTGISCPIIEEVDNTDKFPSFILESENIRITASIQKTAEYLLQKKRAELTEALIGRTHIEAKI